MIAFLEVEEAGLLEGIRFVESACSSRELFVDGDILASLLERLHFASQHFLVEVRDTIDSILQPPIERDPFGYGI